MMHVVYFILFALYLASTVLPFFIFPWIKKGIVYWPATTFAVLAEACPGIWLLSIYLSHRFGQHPSQLTTYLGGCVSFGLMVFLQASALQRIVQRNLAVAKNPDAAQPHE